MRLHDRVDRMAVRRRRSARKVRMSLEILEPRQLLSGVPGFLQGFVYDNLNNPISGATVELLNSGGSTVLHTETTNSAGYYNFNDYSLSPGTTYNLVTPNYATTGVGIQTTVNPATDNTSLPGYAHAIQVTVEDLSTQAFGVTWTGGFAGDTVDQQLNASSYNLAALQRTQAAATKDSFRSRSVLTRVTSTIPTRSARTCSMGSTRTRLSPFSPA